MSYAKSVLQPGETIIAAGRLHWIIYWPALFILLVGTASVWWAWAHARSDALISIAAAAFGVLFLAMFLRAWFIRWITEFAVTDRRVIYKRGFIWRETAEMNMDKVETVDVTQSVFGRMLDYGSIHVKGTGSGIEHLHQIASPLSLRNAIIAK
jgi:uncharacterized membrane protein YdbT with pleckstrin-like domain